MRGRSKAWVTCLAAASVAVVCWVCVPEAAAARQDAGTVDITPASGGGGGGRSADVTSSVPRNEQAGSVAAMDFFDSAPRSLLDKTRQRRSVRRYISGYFETAVRWLFWRMAF